MIRPIYIGVDPAFRAGGFVAAIIDMADKTVVFRTFKNVLAWDRWLMSDESPSSAFVCVENSNLQNQTFDMGGTREKAARHSRNVGTNQAVSQLAYESARERYGDNAFQVSPKQKGKKVTDSRMFGAIVQHDGILLPKGKISQDSRDAYMLAIIARRMALINGKFKSAQSL